MRHEKNAPVAHLKKALAPAYYALTGRGGEFLRRKELVHRRRFESERRFLEEARRDPGLMRNNACPACGASDSPRERFSNPVGFSFAVCPRDATVYMDPIPTTEALERLNNDPAETFAWLGDGDVGPVVFENEQDFAALVQMLPPSTNRRRLLDVGCATGGFITVAKAAFDVEGAELNPNTAEATRRRGFTVHTGPLERLEGEGRYDVITMLQVIEHLPDPTSTLDHVRRLLRPNGHFYVNTPNVASASFSLLRERHVHVSSFGHVSLFDRRGLAALGARSKLELVAHEPCFGSDLALHDWLSMRVGGDRFVHRMALYSPRLYFASEFVEQLTGLSRLLLPRGEESYQRVLFRRSP